MSYPSQRKPNIILIYTDQQRYDALGVNGNSKIKTPNIDKLAEDGAVFSNCFVTTPLCVPSRIALFTGKYDHSMQRYDNSKLLPADELNFVSALRAAGYRTGLSGKDHCFGPLKQEAFDYVREAHHTGFSQPADETEREITEYRRPIMKRPYGDDPFPREQNMTSRIFRYGREFIEQTTNNEKNQPFFLWLSIPDPHPPYMVCEPYASMYDEVEIDIPSYGENEMDNKPFKQQLIREWDAYGRDYPTEEELRKLIRIYWGMVSYIDDQVGKLIQFLKDNRLLEDTLVVFTSDHGDYLGDHRMIRKGPHLYDSLTRVPLLIRGPGIQSGRSEAMTSNIDLFPTLFDIAGLELPGPVHGQSFAKVLRGERDTYRDAVFMEYGAPGAPLRPGELTPESYEQLKSDDHHHLCPAILSGLTKGIRTDRWKLSVMPGDVDELYDLSKDPSELVNLGEHPAYADIVRELKVRMVDWLIQTQHA